MGAQAATIPTTNSIVFLLVSMLVYGRLLLNGLRSFNRLPTKEQRPT